MAGFLVEIFGNYI